MLLIIVMDYLFLSHFPGFITADLVGPEVAFPAMHSHSEYRGDHPDPQYALWHLAG